MDLGLGLYGYEPPETSRFRHGNSNRLAGVRSAQKGESTSGLIELEQQLDYAVYPVHPDGWAESVFDAEGFNQNRPSEYRTVPVNCTDLTIFECSPPRGKE